MFMWRFVFWSLFLLVKLPMFGHPILFYASELPNFRENVIHRSHLLAMGKVNGRWQQLKLQIEEMEDGAQVVRRPQNVFSSRQSLPQPWPDDPYEGRLHGFHRLTVDDRNLFSLSSRDQQWIKSRAPSAVCKSPSHLVDVFHVQSKTMKKDFVLINCKKPVSQFDDGRLNVSVQMAKNQIEGQNYVFFYENDRSLLPTSLAWGRQKSPLISRSEFVGQVRRLMLSFKIETKDLHYYPTSFERKPLSSTLEIASQIELPGLLNIAPSICCDVSFYEDALTFPVILSTPVPGRMFAPASGIFFGLNHTKGGRALLQSMQANLPSVEGRGEVRGAPHSGRITFENDQKTHVAVVSLGADARKGIHPGLGQPESFSKTNFPPVSSRGIFFDITKIKSRQVHFDIWVFFGEISEKAKLERLAQLGFRNAIRQL
jgi:hypothetical protein